MFTPNSTSQSQANSTASNGNAASSNTIANKTVSYVFGANTYTGFQDKSSKFRLTGFSSNDEELISSLVMSFEYATTTTSARSACAELRAASGLIWPKEAESFGKLWIIGFDFVTFGWGLKRFAEFFSLWRNPAVRALKTLVAEASDAYPDISLPYVDKENVLQGIITPPALAHLERFANADKFRTTIQDRLLILQWEMNNRPNLQLADERIEAAGGNIKAATATLAAEIAAWLA